MHQNITLLELNYERHRILLPVAPDSVRPDPEMVWIRDNYGVVCESS